MKKLETLSKQTNNKDGENTLKLMKIAYSNTAFYLKLSLLAKRAKNFNYLFLDKKPKFLREQPNKNTKHHHHHHKYRNNATKIGANGGVNNTMSSSF